MSGTRISLAAMSYFGSKALGSMRSKMGDLKDKLSDRHKKGLLQGDDEKVKLVRLKVARCPVILRHDRVSLTETSPI